MSPLQKYLNIQLYNDHFFKNHSLSILQHSRYGIYNPIDEEAFNLHKSLKKPFPDIKDIWHATNASKCPIEEIPIAPDGLTHLQIQDSKHKLFFIKFTLVSKLRPHLCLIKVDLYSTLALYPSTPPNSIYYCVFLAKHSDDIHKSDEFS